MKVLAPIFVDKPADHVAEAIDGLLEPGEAVLGLQETGPVDGMSDTGWLLTTTRKTMLLAGAEPGMWHIEELSPGQNWNVEPSMGRDAFHLGSRSLFEGPLLGGDTLRRVFELAGSPPAERIYRAAVAHADAGRREDALVLFELARHHLEERATQDESVVPELHQAVFQIARLHYELEQPVEVKDILRELTEMAPDDDLVELSQSAGLEDDDWWELLAESHRAAGDTTSAAVVYGILSEAAEQANRHVLEHARALRDSDEVDRALDCYTDYLDARRPAGSFQFLKDDTDTDDSPDVPDAWLDVALEALELAAGSERRDARFELAVELVRLHPRRAVGYRHLLAIEDQLDDHQGAVTGRIREILHLLNPVMYEQLIADEASPSEFGRDRDLPVRESEVDDDTHDARIVHPEERVRSNAFGKMLGKYVSTKDTSDARLHCELIRQDTYPEPFELTKRLAKLAGLEPPQVFISHQRAGIRALGESDDPFLLIAVSHLDEESPRHLESAALCFALATQIEHIRAGHLILTEAEYHQSLKKKGIQGVFAAVEMLPLGSLLAKTPVSKIAEAVSSFKSSTQRKWLTSALDFAENKSGDAFGWATTKLRSKVSKRESRRDREALMKEQVAAFVLGAIFTADRMGLVACDSLTGAIQAMLRLSPSAFEHIPEAENDGLLALFDKRKDGEPVYRELALRVSELFDFVLSEEYLELV